MRYRTREVSSSKLGLFKLVVPFYSPEEEIRKAELKAANQERARLAINATNQKRRVAAEEKGLRVACQQTPALQGIKLCSRCRSTNHIRNAAAYQNRKAAGLCKRCPNTARKGKADCENCAQKQAEYNQKAHKAKKRQKLQTASEENLTPGQ